MSDATPTTPSGHDPFPPTEEAPGPGRAGRIVAWALWDWATQPFNTVIVTFVFVALYLASDAFIDPEIAALGADDPAYERAIAGLTSGLGLSMTIAGLFIALLAPVLGQRADVTGRRKRWLAGGTVVLVICMFALGLVRADPAYFVLGAATLAVASVAGEIAGVNYNALLNHVATPRSVGRVSGLGWGFGYIGGIVALLLVLLVTSFDFFGMDTSDGMGYRVIAVACGVWCVIFAWPLFRYVPEPPPAKDRPKVGLLRGYVVLWHDIVELWRTSRTTLWFLASAAVYRDGLSGVFTFGAIVATATFGFSPFAVIIFGVAANLLAGVCTILAGQFDDRLGPRTVIVWSLVGLVICGTIVVVLHTMGPLVFWIAGLALTCFVGPAQAASRSYLARVTPPGRESETFGLYATTGRAVSFLTPALWTLLIVLTGVTIWGVVGIIAVLLAGLVMLVALVEPVRA